MKSEEYKTIARKYIKSKNEKFNLFGPLFRKENDKLYLGYMITEFIDNYHIMRPHYWLLQDISSGKIIEFNNIKDKDFVNTELLPLDKIFSFEENDPISVQIRHIKTSFVHWYFSIIDDLNKACDNHEEEIYFDRILLDDEAKVNVYDFLLCNFDDIFDRMDKVLNDKLAKKFNKAFFHYYDLNFENILSDYLDNNNINLELIEKHMYFIKYEIPSLLELINAFNNIKEINTDESDDKLKKYLDSLVDPSDLINKIDEKLEKLSEND